MGQDSAPAGLGSPTFFCHVAPLPQDTLRYTTSSASLLWVVSAQRVGNERQEVGWEKMAESSSEIPANRDWSWCPQPWLDTHLARTGVLTERGHAARGLTVDTGTRSPGGVRREPALAPGMAACPSSPSRDWWPCQTTGVPPLSCCPLPFGTLTAGDGSWAYAHLPLQRGGWASGSGDLLPQALSLLAGPDLAGPSGPRWPRPAPPGPHY